ncbi:7-cyano-7-deazaguanine reductase [Thioploca ingrica]|uniref:7-carboxy-7-deazaguanine synthase n=1 Tax=Thioploca ingrica TaxID=40754 RepID=A0A090AC14_9GAMM|nr:7-cyano-7-deazaguanine reductase [Thioploca ingrica]
MTYIVKEIFYTLQGEGLHTGRAAVFCRFSGCNLWSGRELDRAKAICPFCDTDFVGIDGQGGGKFNSAQALVEQVVAHWPWQLPGHPYVVCTGGEPLLQLDNALIEAFHQAGLEVAVETNGTLPLPPGIDWVCVSPKAQAPLVVQSGDELKLVFPQVDALPDKFQQLNFKYFFLQPLADSQQVENTRLAVHYCLKHPQWRLSLQTHKWLEIP